MFFFIMLTVLHPLVDACSVFVLVQGGFTPERWVVYGVLAFALECPLGLLLDAQRAWVKGILGMGCALAACGAAARLAGLDGWMPLVVACVGNALFHLAAGTWVMERADGKSGPVGLFISTGALGLAAGQCAARSGACTTIAGVAAALAVGGVLWLWRHRGEEIPRATPRISVRTHGDSRAAMIVGLGLFAVIAWRSWAGLEANMRTQGEGVVLIVAAAVATWVGKAAGGFLADATVRYARLGVVGGCLLVTLISVVGSAALLLCSPRRAALWIGLLLVTQVATGPVLTLLRRACGNRSGTAFGLNCLGLFVGSLGCGR